MFTSFGKNYNLDDVVVSIWGLPSKKGLAAMSEVVPLLERKAKLKMESHSPESVPSHPY